MPRLSAPPWNRLPVLLSGALFPPLAGCNILQQLEVCHRQNLELRDKVAELQAQLTAREERLDILEQRARTLQGLGPLELDKIPHTHHLRFGTLSGGHDYDSQPGDDGITVYLQPIDADGHVIKAAGSIQAQILDLANPDGQHLIAEYQFGVDETRELWEDRFATRHYRVKCPWPDGHVPAHRRVTVRLVFTDYVTGRALELQQAFSIRFPPGRSTTAGR